MAVSIGHPVAATLLKRVFNTDLLIQAKAENNNTTSINVFNLKQRVIKSSSLHTISVLNDLIRNGLAVLFAD